MLGECGQEYLGWDMQKAEGVGRPPGVFGVMERAWEGVKSHGEDW